MEGGTRQGIRVEKTGGYAVVSLNRPQFRNALSFGLISEIADALADMDGDSGVGAVVIAGDEKAFSGGADVREMADNSVVTFTKNDYFAVWDRIGTFRKPLIAAVEGYALGGGCELAMACDIVVASEQAKFGQPEINLGIMPGAGGTQRLTRAAGKHKAMYYILTGDQFSAAEAERLGIASVVVPAGKAMSEACRIASAIASKPAVAVIMAKRAVRQAADEGLKEGMMYERALFYSLFGTHDQKEGMDAFLKKRKPEFRGE